MDGTGTVWQWIAWGQESNKPIPHSKLRITFYEESRLVGTLDCLGPTLTSGETTALNTMTAKLNARASDRLMHAEKLEELDASTLDDD